jgi:hypothetical protein
MRKIIRDNGLLLANLGLFLLFLIAMSISGAHTYNGDQLQHHQATISYLNYLGTGNFIEGVFENWESEFLQMGMYVVLTAYLFQRGSAESKPIDEDSPQDQDPRTADLRHNVPWPVRRGGAALKVYENSLVIFFFGLFFLSIVLHAYGGARDYSANQTEHGGQAVSTWQFVQTSDFWYQSFQNWQSEFLAVAAIVGGSVYLRQRGSSESKPVAAPHTSTGS